MKLEPKHLFAYAPYGVKCQLHLHIVGWKDRKLSFDSGHDFYNKLEDGLVRLFLRPISDLTKEMEFNGKKFIPMYHLFRKYCHILPDEYSLDVGKNIILMDVKQPFFEWYFVYHIKEMMFEFSRKDESNYKNLNQYNMFEELKSWHFDIFGLIDAGLAVDINTVKF